MATEQAITLPYGSNERSEAIRQTLTLMSKEIEDLARYNTVIIDRFYASWASAEAGVGNFKIATLSMQDWPKDLIKPDLSVHLRVDEEERLRRIGTRDFQNQREFLPPDRNQGSDRSVQPPGAHRLPFPFHYDSIP